MISKEDAYKIVLEKLQSKLFLPFETAEYVCMDEGKYVFLLKAGHPTCIGVHPSFYLVDQQGCIDTYAGRKYYHLLKQKTSLKKTIKNFFSPYRDLVKACLDLLFEITKDKIGKQL